MRLTPERLLRNERVRSHGASMDLVRHQMAKLHHINVANHHILMESIACASIKKLGFTVFLHPGKTFLLLRIVEIFANLFLLDSVEYRCRDFESERLRSNAQVSFQNLPHIHSARYA